MVLRIAIVINIKQKLNVYIQESLDFFLHLNTREKRFEGPKFADFISTLRKTHLNTFMKNYKVQCSRNHDYMNLFANDAPIDTKNPGGRGKFHFSTFLMICRRLYYGKIISRHLRWNLSYKINTKHKCDPHSPGGEYKKHDIHSN